MPSNEYILREDLAGIYRLAPRVWPFFQSGISAAKGYGFAEFSIDHVIHALLETPVLQQMICSVGGDYLVVKSSLEASFEEHSKFHLHWNADMRIAVSDSLKQLADSLDRHVADFECDNQEEIVRYIVLQLVNLIGESRIAEAAFTDGGAQDVFLHVSVPEMPLEESWLPDVEIDEESILEDEDLDMFFAHHSNASALGDVLSRKFRPVGWRQDGTGDVQNTVGTGDHGSSSGKSKGPDSDRIAAPESQGVSGATLTKNGKADEVSDAVLAALRDLGSEAMAGNLDPCIGRDEEVATILSTLRRRTKGSIIIYGEAGVGKTAIAEGVAMRLREAEIEASLSDRPYYELNLGTLVAGARYRGDFEARMSKLIEKVSSERAIVFIDEIHMIIGAGSTLGREMDAGNLLKPALARGEFTIIGATTPLELRALRKDSALMRRFELLAIRQPTRSETADIVERASWTYLRYHDVTMDCDVVGEVCRVTDLYQPERNFPDKAFDLLDLSCVVAREERIAAGDNIRKARVTKSHVMHAARKMGLRVPSRPSQAQENILKALPVALRKDVFGQNPAIEMLVDIAQKASLNLQNTGPRSVMTVSGPHGSGKSCILKSFADAMNLPLMTIDVRARIESPGSFLLCGGVAGGQDRPGLLVQAGDIHKNMVLAIENIDQADSSAMDVIGSLLETGRVSAHDGRPICFQGAWVFLVMSSEDAESGHVGFGSPPSQIEKDNERIEKSLSQQIRSAVKHRMNLDLLDEPSLRKIVNRAAEGLCERCRDLGAHLSVTEGAIRLIARQASNGWDAVRIVEEELQAMIVNDIVYGDGINDIIVSDVNGKIRSTGVIKPDSSPAFHSEEYQVIFS